MPQTLGLSKAASVILDASGNGMAQLGPQLPGTSWQVATVAVSVATNVNEAQCYLYAGISATAGQLIGATSTGSTGDSDDLAGQGIWPGQSLIAVWAGGDPGAEATLSVFGTQNVPG
jgi:hypothetical protein